MRDMKGKASVRCSVSLVDGRFDGAMVLSRNDRGPDLDLDIGEEGSISLQSLKVLRNITENF